MVLWYNDTFYTTCFWCVKYIYVSMVSVFHFEICYRYPLGLKAIKQRKTLFVFSVDKMINIYNNSRIYPHIVLTLFHVFAYDIKANSTCSVYTANTPCNIHYTCISLGIFCLLWHIRALNWSEIVLKMGLILQYFPVSQTYLSLCLQQMVMHEIF
jgi:hypothetical protein